MKSIKQQYIDLTEGKMSQANFLRNIRMSLPQYVTNITSFGDTVKILKNKGIISENNVSKEEPSNDEFDAMIKKIEDEKTGEEAIKGQYDINEANITVKQIVDTLERLFNENENRADIMGDVAKKLNITKQELAKIIGLPHLYPSESGTMSEAKKQEKAIKAADENLEEVITGINIEHECHPDWTYDDVQKLVKKNIKKNPNYYTNYKLTGIRDYKTQTMDTSKPEDHQMKFYTEKTAVDTARGMKKVKMPKVVKEGMEVDSTGTLQPTGMPTSSDVMRIFKYMKSNKTFLSLLKNLNSVGEYTDFFRELLQLTDPELDALKVSDTQLQNIFRKAVIDKKKEDGVPNQIFKRNSNIQKGLNDIGDIKEADQPTDDKIETELSSALSQNPTLKRILQKVDLPQEVNGTIKALLDRTNLKNVPDVIILAALRKVLNDQPGPTFTAQHAINKNIGKPLPDLEEQLRLMVREILAEEEIPSKKKAAEEITVKMCAFIEDYNEGEKTYKKSQLENVFDSYEDKVGHRFDDSVFENVIDMLKTKGYTMSIKETFDGRDNLTDISDDTKD
jgi:uncharacterized protein YjiS (DUF1127 family)